MWLLDNGHGGIIDGVYQTQGKRSPVWPDGRQLFEGEFNRAVVKYIKKYLDILEIDNIIIVPELKDISLSERVRRINEYCKQYVCKLLSIHANAGGGNGWEVFTSLGETRSDKMATVFMDKMKVFYPNKKFRIDLTDGDIDKESNFTIITKTNCPAILTENFFMDNKEDCDILFDDYERKKIAMAHVMAIQKIEKLKL